MNGKVTNFTHPVETAEDASQSDFNLFVSPKEARFLTGERKEKPGFRGSWGFPSSLHPSPTHKQAIQGDSGVGPRGLGRHLQTVSAAGPSGEFARTPRRGRPLGAPRQRRRPTGSAQGRVHSAPGPAAEPKAASDLAEGLAPPGRRLHLPSSSPGHAGLPCRPPDTHRPALPNLGPGPGCRGRRARLLRAVPEPLRAPHPRAVRLLIARLPRRGAAFSLLFSSSSYSRNSASSPGSRPPRAPRPTPLRPAHLAWLGLGGGGRRSSSGEPGGSAHAEPGGDAPAGSLRNAHVEVGGGAHASQWHSNGQGLGVGMETPGLGEACGRFPLAAWWLLWAECFQFLVGCRISYSCNFGIGETGPSRVNYLPPWSLGAAAQIP